jgi:uncharacterized protein
MGELAIPRKEEIDFDQASELTKSRGIRIRSAEEREQQGETRIDFVEAQALWKSKHAVLGAKDALEKRYLVIGTIEGRYWSAIITYRGAVIRIISVRKSTPLEVETYARIAR